MGLFDRLKGKKEEPEGQGRQKQEEEQPEGKYTEECSYCGGTGTEKKWMGQYWHKKCLRSMKRGARKMV